MALRLQQNQAEEEDASQLKLGSEFSNDLCLSISEVRFLLELPRERGAPDTQVYNKTLDYVRTFTKFPTQESTQAVRALISRGIEDLAQFETAQIANLTPLTADEAKSVIPTLQRYDDEVMQGILDEMQTLRKFQT
ncbi:RNA polymerase II [Calocera cornea HHB12733]|uniref:RNA polymerase II n=1 Tax=Calocera cornea HHB12733 TaxID=1353952 RepID=A0A165HKN3_9BASI|nr:RNA polymerase II [Calocera cornea HHB12733]